MNQLFFLAVKSTIDKIGSDLAAASALGTKATDMDDYTATEEIFHSESSAVLWELSSMDEDPRDPMYSVVFNIGARTCNDAANYKLAKVLGEISSMLGKDLRIPIKDYSGAVASAPLGFLHIVKQQSAPQSFDRTSGIRMIQVTARALRWV
jgi:hypothetical protein